MILSKLFKGAPDINIDGFMLNSKKKSENSIFFCIEGSVFNGHDFVDEAIANGAVCVVFSKSLTKWQKGIVYLQVDDTFKVLTDVVKIFYDDPGSKIDTIGVTGTNGKTTVAYTIKSILNRFEKTGYIGTLSIEYGDNVIESNNTTPEITDLLCYLNNMVKDGCKSVTIETTSQGLDQGRVEGIDFDYTIFTNLSHEHLDYHQNMDDYFSAKKLLFKGEKKTSIVNIDDEYGKKLFLELTGRKVSYGIYNNATYMAKDIEIGTNYTNFTLDFLGTLYRVETNFVAMFNVYNLLAVIACLNQKGIKIESILPLLKEIDSVDGRMDLINDDINFNVLVDFAHTPDGFEKIYSYASAITPSDKKIISVFGSAGKRDKLKRPVFGQIASKYSDLIILTEDDNRDEKVEDICREIQEGVSVKSLIVTNRYDAIYQAMMQANQGDTVLVLGKGSETFMYREKGKEPWIGDNNAVKDIIKNNFIKEDEFNESI